MTDEPYPGYIYDDVAARRAQALQVAGRDVVDAIGGSLFDTEPALIVKTMLALHLGQPS